jgi:hypothetical protein
VASDKHVYVQYECGYLVAKALFDLETIGAEVRTFFYLSFFVFFFVLDRLNLRNDFHRVFSSIASISLIDGVLGPDEVCATYSITPFHLLPLEVCEIIRPGLSYVSSVCCNCGFYSPFDSCFIVLIPVFSF